MTNEQLYTLLSGLLSELDTAIDEAREAMPEDAEREVYTEWRVKPENRGKIFTLTPIEETHDLHTVNGEYTALLPLVALRDAWQERANVLVNDEVSE